MQGSKRTRFGGMLLAVWAIAVLVLLIVAYLSKSTSDDAPYDGAMFVQAEEVEGARHV